MGALVHVFALLNVPIVGGGMKSIVFLTGALMLVMGTPAVAANCLDISSLIAAQTTERLSTACRGEGVSINTRNFYQIVLDNVNSDKVWLKCSASCGASSRCVETYVSDFVGAVIKEAYSSGLRSSCVRYK